MKCAICKETGHRANNRKFHPIKYEPIPSDVDDILAASFWKSTKAFMSIVKKQSQLKYYETKGASPEVLHLVQLESKAFGSECEKLISELFGLGPRTSSQNDATFRDKRIEIKSARYWQGSTNCRWQHLEPDHDYQVVLFVLLDFQGLKVWGITKELLMGELRDKKVVTYQGKQGWWLLKDAAMSFLTPIRSRKDLHDFIPLPAEDLPAKAETE